MLKILRILFFVVLSVPAFFVYASETACPRPLAQPAPAVVQEAMRKAQDHGFLWRISRDGRTSFLYGTIHVAKFDWMFPGTQVMKAILATDTLALELDIMDPDIQSRLATGMAALPRTALPVSLNKRMRQQAEQVCVPYASIAQSAPEMQITTLTIMTGRRDGLEAAYAIDAVLAGIGHSSRRAVVSLETPEQQLQLLKMESPQETISFVQDSLQELESGRSLKMIKRIAKVWADSDYNEMEHFSEWCECLKTDSERAWMKRALDDRNPALAENIDALHTSGKQVFAAVGSLHMFGQAGLPKLLEQRGYRVERVSLRQEAPSLKPN